MHDCDREALPSDVPAGEGVLSRGEQDGLEPGRCCQTGPCLGGTPCHGAVPGPGLPTALDTRLNGQGCTCGVRLS